MKLQLREIFQVTGMHLPVSYSIPLSELEDVHGYTFAEPIAVEGEFVNRAGIVTLNYQVSCRLDAVCDRCLKPFTPSFSYTFSHTVVPLYRHYTVTIRHMMPIWSLKMTR